MLSQQGLFARRSSAAIMQEVMLACLPALLALTVLYGIGTLLNLVWTVTAALLCESLACKLRQLPIKTTLADGSALLTALLLALALPPAVPWWICVLAVASALLLAKHPYGGLGHNVFNPAMAGYAVVLVCFPSFLLSWPEAFVTPSVSLSYSFGFIPVIDSYTSATVLTVVQQNSSLMMEQLFNDSAFGSVSGAQSQWINAAFLLGGVYLLWQRIISWHVPVAFLLSLTVISLFYYDGGSSVSAGSPLFHLFAGGTMMAAFFILTDPVTGCADKKAKLLFGAIAGVLVFVIRHYASYPDGLVFAVLMLNMAAPLLDRLSLLWDKTP